MNNWAKSVNPVIGNTEVSAKGDVEIRATVERRDCAASNNVPMSARHPMWMKMYAELPRN